MEKYIFVVSNCESAEHRLEFMHESKFTADEFNNMCDTVMMTVIERDTEARKEKYGSNKRFIKSIDYDIDEVILEMEAIGFTLHLEPDTLHYEFNIDYDNSYSDDM